MSLASLAKQPLFEPQLSLEDSARLHPVFTSLDFATAILFFLFIYLFFFCRPGWKLAFGLTIPSCKK
jgi:quinol-cytochrome oxidoreductase complex cytochrome b subunit